MKGDLEAPTTELKNETFLFENRPPPSSGKLGHILTFSFQRPFNQVNQDLKHFFHKIQTKAQNQQSIHLATTLFNVINLLFDKVLFTAFRQG